MPPEVGSSNPRRENYAGCSSSVGAPVVVEDLCTRKSFLLSLAARKIIKILNVDLKLKSYVVL